MSKRETKTPPNDDFYINVQRRPQEEDGTAKLSEEAIQTMARDKLEDYHIAYIESRDYFFLSTVTEDGEPTVSYKGGPAGLVRSLGHNRLLFPIYEGNGMWLSTGNIDVVVKVGMLFMDFETPWRIRVQGEANLSKDPNLVAHFSGCNMVAVVDVNRVFQNCARTICKHKRVEEQLI